MCFSVNVNLVKEEIEERYGVNFPGKYRYEPSYYYHAFGLPEIPAICSGNQSTVTMLRWGLIPEWVKTEEEAKTIRFKTFNARSESVMTKPSFSASFTSKRCIIPVKGFFEWQHVGEKKIPWYIYLPDDRIMSLAGIYSDWQNRSTGVVESTFSIITTDANELMAEIHNSGKRMPAILKPGDENKWIDTSISPGEAITLLNPCTEELKAHTIGPLVNNRAENRNTPEVIRPFSYILPGSLF
jgi:putative SOS response-associated peptidase YedK